MYGSEVVQFRTILEAIIHNMNHEAVEVRLQSITMLKNLLEANMGALQGMLLRSDQVGQERGFFVTDANGSSTLRSRSLQY